MQSLSICAMLPHLLARDLVGSHHAWTDCMPTLFPTNMQVFVHQSLAFCLGTTQLAMHILRCGTWKQGCPHNIATGHTTSLCCFKSLILCVVLHITAHECGISGASCTSSVSLTTSCPTSWDWLGLVGHSLDQKLSSWALLVT